MNQWCNIDFLNLHPSAQRSFSAIGVPKEAPKRHFLCAKADVGVGNKSLKECVELLPILPVNCVILGEWLHKGVWKDGKISVVDVDE